MTTNVFSMGENGEIYCIYAQNLDLQWLAHMPGWKQCEQFDWNQRD